MANDAFGGLRAMIDEAMNILWAMFNDAGVTDGALDVTQLLMYF